MNPKFIPHTGIGQYWEGEHNITKIGHEHRTMKVTYKR